MKVWASLYTMVWLVFFELLVAIDPRPPSWSLYLHAGLGALIVLLAASNYVRVRSTTAPGRIKRTVRATLWLSGLMAVLGILLWANVGHGWSLALGYTFWDAVDLLHAVNGLAILAQAAAVATSFDMWEEKEYDRASVAGAIPSVPRVRG